MLRIQKIDSRKGELVRQAVCHKLKGFVVCILTSDNGREFSEHESIAKSLNASFFCHPYASWERGLNENSNDFLHQYSPGRSFWANISNEQIADVEQNLNNRPCKSLGFLTPNEVYFKELQLLTRVALTTLNLS